jgi:hypothetical protein
MSGPGGQCAGADLGAARSDFAAVDFETANYQPKIRIA